MARTPEEYQQIINQLSHYRDQMLELCDVQDPSIFDITYNLSEQKIKPWSYDICQILQDRAIKGKRILLDSSTTSYEHNRNYQDLRNVIEKYLNQVIDILFDLMIRAGY